MARRRRKAAPVAEAKQLKEKLYPDVKATAPTIELDKSLRLICSKSPWELVGLPGLIEKKLGELGVDAGSTEAPTFKQQGGPPTGNIGDLITSIKNAKAINTETLKGIHAVAKRQLENSGLKG